jgi:hypothetical protein
MALDIVQSNDAVPDDDGGSLAEHEAQFKSNGQQATKTVEMGPDDEDDDDGAATERDKSGRFQPRHRAKSQEAAPEDVKEIQALTKQLREKEAELAKHDPNAVNGSKRLLNLKRQIKALDADLASYQPKPVDKPKAEPVPATFEEKEPTLADFADQPDPYLAFTRALGAYDRRKEAFEAKKTEATTAVSEARKQKIDAYQARTQAFAAKTPDFDTVTKPVIATNLPELLVAAIIESDKGPEFVYALGQHSDVLDEFVLLTDSKPVTEALVASVQRRLSQRVQAAPTGSAAESLPSYIPPRPPNPVRTGPIRTGEELPGDDASLAEHERAYGPKRRR